MYATCGPVCAQLGEIAILDIRQEAGSLYDLLDFAMLYVAKNIKWRFEFDGSPERIEIPEIPTDAVREALINAFCHRDYTSSLDVQVDIFADRVDVFSPGRFPEGVDPEDCLSGRIAFSQSRNKLLAEALFRAKDIEKYGTGMPRIKEQCDAAGVEVRYASHRKGVTVSFYRPDWSRLGPGGDTGNDTLNDPINDAELGRLSKGEKAVLDAIAQDRLATASQIVERTHLGEATVKRAFSNLQKKGLLRRIGSKKTGYWEVL